MDDFIIKGPVMIPGITDRVGDRRMTGEEIQKGAYQFLSDYGVVDVQHSFKKIGKAVESYVTPEPTKFNNRDYPAGTWFVTTQVTDTDVQQAIMKGELTGYSVGALPEKTYQQTKRIFKGLFSDVDEGAWFPFTVSIVDIPAVGDAIFKVYAPTEFIKKEGIELEDNIMENENIIGKVLDYFIKKEEGTVIEPVVEEAPAYLTVEEFNTKMEEFKAELTPEPVEEVEEVEAEPIVDEVEPIIKEEPVEEVIEEEVVEEPITKSLPVDKDVVKKESLMQKLNRDHNGCKIE